MADILSKAERSRRMKAIKSRGNRSTELAMIHVMRLQKLSGWRRRSAVFGSPDFVFPAQRLAVFVDGCFWHGCPLHYKAPRNQGDFWAAKIERNRARDRVVNRELRKRGWSIHRIWEHSVKRKSDHPRLVKLIRSKLEKADRKRSLP